MKILQVGATFVGAQKKIENAIHDYVRAQGHDSRIFFAIGESDDGDVVCYENRVDSIIRRGLRKVFGKNPRFAWLSTRKLIAHIKEYNPDLVHIHIIHHGYLDYELLLDFLAQQKVPVVFTVHDMWFFTGGCYYYSAVGCNGFLNECKNCPANEKQLDCRKRETAKALRTKMRLYTGLEKACFVSVSPWVYSEIQKSMLNIFPQYLSMNAIDKVAHALPDVEKKRKFTLIGVATNWDNRKGLHRFYELGEAVKDLCDIILVGTVAEELKAGAPANIIFHGYANSSEELYNLYAGSDLHVSMSLEETFGLTFVEAALAGIKSMGFASTAIPDVLSKTKGYLIASCTVEEASAKIRELSQNRELCKITGEEFDEIRYYFSPQRMAAEYLEVYEKMYNSNK